MIYLDNAATTNYKPQQIVDAVVECLTKYPFNPNRGNNRYAMPLQQKLVSLRQKLVALCNCPDGQVALTSGCTAALNLAILGNAKRRHIVISATEHNSVLRPVMQLKKRGLCDVSVVFPNEQGLVTLENVQKLWRNDTYMLCVSHASNVTGQRQRLAELGAFVRQKGGIFLVDCAQSVGYFSIDMKQDNVDIVAIGAHKGLHAMQGAGALVFGSRAVPRPILFGGTGTESDKYFQPQTVPDGLESGTLPTPALVAMGAGLDWWVANRRQNSDTVQQMQRLVLDGLQQISNVHLYSRPNKSGIVAFNLGNAESGAVADMLMEKYDIAVRGGLQCAPLMHRYLGTSVQGVVRASVSCVTTKQECYALLNAVDDLAKHLAT